MTNSVSNALLAKTTIITNRKNPANHANFQNGTRGNSYTSRFPVNLGANTTNATCIPGLTTNIPQSSVTNTSSLLRRRAFQMYIWFYKLWQDQFQITKSNESYYFLFNR